MNAEKKGRLQNAVLDEYAGDCWRIKEYYNEMLQRKSRWSALFFSAEAFYNNILLYQILDDQIKVLLMERKTYFCNMKDGTQMNIYQLFICPPI